MTWRASGVDARHATTNPAWAAGSAPTRRAGRDASNPQSLNQYAYVLNNPTSNVDPLGLDGCDPEFDTVCPGSGSECSITDAECNPGMCDPDVACDPNRPGGGSVGNGAPPVGPGGIGIWGGGMGSGPLSGDYGVGLPPLSGSGGLPCDFGTCTVGMPGGNGFMSPDDIELNHLFSKEFAWFWNQVPILYNQWLVPMTAAAHRLLPNGIHTNAGGNWNKVWDEWISKNPKATPEQAWQQLSQMMKQFGIAGETVLGDVVITVNPCAVNPQQFSFCQVY